MKSRHQFITLLLIGYFLVYTDSMTSCFSQITPPEDYLGYKPGADFHLATYEQLVGYFDLLASQTDRLQMFDMGPTTEGRRMRYAIISSEENMANLDMYKVFTIMNGLPVLVYHII